MNVAAMLRCSSWGGITQIWVGNALDHLLYSRAKAEESERDGRKARAALALAALIGHPIPHEKCFA